MKKEWASSSVKHGCYKTMVKAGEVYYSQDLPDQDYMDLGDDRARNIMVGSESKHGAACYF